MRLAAAALLLPSAAAADCSTDLDCSLNGECKKGGCVCDEGWHGSYCHQLNLEPAVNGSGLDQLHTSARTSTWGGSVLRSDDGKYHMWASEISRHCGIHRWVTNSVVVHAVSDGPPEWRFERKEEVFGLFSHEPIVARAPTGEYVMYITHYPGDASDCPTCNCSDGNSYSGEAGCAGECGGSKSKSLNSFFAYASSPDGPWSELRSLAKVQDDPHTDMNLAPVILPDGSAIAWTRWDIWRATDWRNVSTWRNTGQAPDFNHGGTWEGEDPSMWVDKRGHFHSVSHNGDRGRPGNTGDCGRHMFSETGDAGTWKIVGPKEEMGQCAYPRVRVPFSDGTARTFYRRERPHVVLGPDGTTPVALTTSVIDSPSREAQDPQRDASYTLIQAVAASPVPAPPTPRPPPPTPSPPAPTTCAGKCAAAGHCCEGKTSACAQPSCQQGCLIATLTKDHAACVAACKSGSGKCDYSVKGAKLDNCGMCPCAADCGGASEAGCELGCGYALPA